MAVNEREFDEVIRVNLLLVDNATEKLTEFGRSTLPRGSKGIKTAEIWQTWLHRTVQFC